MAQDHYKTLGIRRNASQDEIQQAYRDLARKYHPDLNPNDKQAKEKFQQVQAAFDVLGDAEKREMYDRYGSSFETTGPGGPWAGGTWHARPGAGSGSGGGFGVEDIDFSQFFGERFGAEPGGGFADIFSQFHQSGAGTARKHPRGRPRRGADIQHELPIPLKTAVTGGEAQVTVRRGSGKVETITVKIPAGVKDNQKIRLRGQGEPAPRGGPPGDILLAICVTPHASFRRRGNHLHVQVPVTLSEAARGAKVDVPTPHGTVSLRIPAGTSSGAKLRVKGHGVVPKDGPPGDLLAEVQIVLPEKLDETGRRLIEQLEEYYAEDPRADLRW